MRRPRFRLRTLVILVAVAALAFGIYAEVVRMGRTAEGHRRRAADHERESIPPSRRALDCDQGAALNRRYAADARSRGRLADADDFAGRARSWAEEAEEWRARSRYHDLLRSKYERAARYPWLPVEPDPTPPE
jgi:hypothetical protein